MRSKEVENAIERLKNGKNTAYFGSNTAIYFIKDVDTVLSYISELEQDVKDAMDGYQDLGKDLAFNFISKEDIRDKIKELEREKRILEDNKMKDKMVYTPYQIVNAEILRLKELLEEE